MKNIFLLAIFFGLSCLAWSQTKVEFLYDNAGNRTSRQIVNLNSAFLSDSIEISKEIIGEREIRLFPNPTAGVLTMDIANLKSDESIIVLVTDMAGKVLLRQVQKSANFKIDLTSQPKGFYILSSTIGNERKEWKIIKE